MKGQEEGWVQLAEDFSDLQGREPRGEPQGLAFAGVPPPKDDANLVYVAASRALQGLILPSGLSGIEEAAAGPRRGLTIEPAGAAHAAAAPRPCPMCREPFVVPASRAVSVLLTNPHAAAAPPVPPAWLAAAAAAEAVFGGGGGGDRGPAPLCDECYAAGPLSDLGALEAPPAAEAPHW